MKFPLKYSVGNVEFYPEKILTMHDNKYLIPSDGSVMCIYSYMAYI
jgi:hypothetical protein